MSKITKQRLLCCFSFKFWLTSFLNLNFTASVLCKHKKYLKLDNPDLVKNKKHIQLNIIIFQI